MFNDIFDTIIKGSNTMFLDIPEDEYYLSYNDLSYENAQGLVDSYFLTKGKDGIPKVIDTNIDPVTHRVKITLEVEMDREHKLEEYTTPDIFNMTRGMVRRGKE